MDFIINDFEFATIEDAIKDIQQGKMLIFKITNHQKDQFFARNME